MGSPGGDWKAAFVCSSPEIGLLSLEPRWMIRPGLCLAPQTWRKRARETESLRLWVAQGRFLSYLLWAQVSKPWSKGRKRVNIHSLGPPWPASWLGARRGSAVAELLSQRPGGGVAPSNLCFRSSPREVRGQVGLPGEQRGRAAPGRGRAGRGRLPDRGPPQAPRAWPSAGLPDLAAVGAAASAFSSASRPACQAP